MSSVSTKGLRQHKRASGQGKVVDRSRDSRFIENGGGQNGQGKVRDPSSDRRLVRNGGGQWLWKKRTAPSHHDGQPHGAEVQGGSHV
jgi:hypothetical protein